MSRHSVGVSVTLAGDTNPTLRSGPTYVWVRLGGYPTEITLHVSDAAAASRLAEVLLEAASLRRSRDAGAISGEEAA